MSISNKYSLYSHISPSGNIYVGITSLLPEIRWGANGVKYCKHPQYPIARAISKYGWDSFKHEILFSSITEEQAKRFERHLIAFYKLLGISYNITDGGESGNGNKSHLGQHPSEETRHKMSLSGGQAVYQYSKEGDFIKKWDSQKIAADALKIRRSSISAANCGRIPSAGGYYWSQQPPDNWVKPIKRHNESGRKKPIYQFSQDGELLNSWDSLTDMHKDKGYSVAQIALACCYDGKAKGYLWSYSSEIELKKIAANKNKQNTK